MKRLEHHLSKRGYRVINATYRSRKVSVETLAEQFLGPLLRENIQDPEAKVNFVTHSLGGIIVRQYLSGHVLENAGRMVMMAPPNHGSEIIDRLRANPISRRFLGVASKELGTRVDDLPRRLGPVQFECGVIAGDRSQNPLFSAMLTGPNDGKVTVESAKLDGMTDFLVLHSGHTWLMWRERTLKQIDSFLAHGRFDHQPTPNS
jgi:hypothetical protein